VGKALIAAQLLFNRVYYIIKIKRSTYFLKNKRPLKLISGLI
jgi:hypothetical protein